jgi:DNA-binding transcriptional ArsR family regulator
MAAGRPKASRDVFRAVADPTRRGVLEVLGRRRESTVSELVTEVGVEMPILSRHLAVLREAGVVTERRDGRLRRYRIDPEPLHDLYDWASLFSELWEE